MWEKLNRNNYLSLLLTIILGIFICAGIIFITRFDILTGDDLDQVFFNYDFKQTFLRSDHGSILSWFMIKIVGSFIPLYFGVHCNDNTLGLIIRSANVSLYIFLLSYFASLLNKNKQNMPAWYMLVFLFFINYFCNNSYCDSTFIYEYSQNFRCIFMGLFYWLFWLIFILKYLNLIKLDKKLLIAYSIISFFVGCSMELFLFSTFYSLLLFSAINLFSIFKMSGYKFKAIKERVAKIKGIELIPYISFVLGSILTLSNPGFWQVAETERNTISNLFALDCFKNAVFNYTKIWFDKFFLESPNNILLLMLIALSLIIFVLGKKSNRIKYSYKVIFISWVLVFGCGIFYLSLIFPTSNKGEALIWLSSHRVTLFVENVYMAANLLLAGFVFKLIYKNKNLEKALSSIFIVLVLLLSVKELSVSKDKISHFMNYEKEKRTYFYKIEKMILFYIGKGEDIILPLSIIKYDKDITFQFVAFWCNDTGLYEVYLPGIYKIHDFEKIKLIEDSKAWAKFYEEGGTFDKSELTNPSFTRLLKEYKK